MILRRYALFFFSIIPVLAFAIVFSGLIPGTSTSSQAQACGSITFPYTLPDNARDTLVTAIECANANGTADIIDLNGFTVALPLNDTYAEYQAHTGLPQITTNITLRDGTIEHDNSTGGFLFRTFDIASTGTLNLVNMTLLGDSAPDPGGAFYNLGTLNVTNSTITGYSTSNRGGVLYNGSGSTASFTNALFYDNNAVDAHVMDNLGSITIVNSTFDKHTSISNFGSILEGSGYVIRNSILWNPGSGPGQISAGNTVSDSIVKGGYSGGTNILDTDPLFANEAGDDFRLQVTSPAINAGANAYVPADSTDVDSDSNVSEDTPDLDLNPRIAATVVDMGAYERQDAAPPDPCLAISFPYTLPDNAPATLVTAIECANVNGSADVIDLDGQTVTLTDSFADYTGATGLPQITTNMTLQNGTITRSGGNQFRLLSVGLSGNLTLNNLIATNGYGLATGSMGGGGAIYNLGALNLVGGRFSGNYSAQDGGAIHNDGGAMNARYTVFSGNSANTSHGGVGGGIANSFGVVTLSNVLISGNLGVQGAGIYNNNGGTLTLNNSTIAGNSTNDQGGGLRNENTAASVVVNNTVISGNESSLFPATSDLGGSITNNFSLVGGSPAFVAPLDASTTAPTTGGDYRLADFSPAIDAGDNSLVPGIISADLDNNPRRYNDTGVTDTGSGTAPIVDMGAYEKQTDSIVDPCLSITFPYTLPDNLAVTLVTAIECANANGASADTIDFNSQIVTLMAPYADYTGATGLPQITTPVTLENAVITRSGGAPQFRLLAVSAAGNLTLDGVILSGGNLSSSDNAGAILNSGALNILNSSITNNSAGFGGALYNNGPASVITITNSTLSNNSATHNGGFMMNDSGSVTIIRSTVSGNSSSGPSGNGAIYNFEADLDILDSTFSGNTSTASVGAVQNFAGTTNIANSVFAGNSAANTTGAVLNNASGVMTITNSAFTGNRAGNIGGALINNALSTLTITNSTFAGNNSTAGGGGIYIPGTNTTTITNSIIWGNNGNTLTGATVTYSIIEDGFAGIGNLNVDPLFVAPVAFASAPTSTGNYRLQDSSPAVDAGSNAAVPVDIYDLNDNASATDEAPDLAGNPRRYDDTGVADTGSGTAPTVDMGAYEKQTNSPAMFPEDVDYCNLQFPSSFTAATGSTSPFIYGRIYEDDNGVFTSSPGAHPSIVGQLGYGPLGSDPRGGNPAWQWLPTTYNVQDGNDDEYQATFTVPFAPTGTQRAYTYRFSVDSGANYTYCDTDGNGTNGGLGFSTASLGTLTINPGGQSTISINDVSQNEGNSGTTNFNFTVSLNGPSLSAVTFDIATADNTATAANGDYSANSQTGFVIPAGQTSTAFTVVVNGDTSFEPNETFFVNVTNIVGATAGDVQGTGTIINDDVDPCAAYTFPYTMTGSTPAELIQAINCANLNGPSADTIDLNGQTVMLTVNYANLSGAIGLPQITTEITIRNGTITRSGIYEFRLLGVGATGNLTLREMTLTNGGGSDYDSIGGIIFATNGSTLTVVNSTLSGGFAAFHGGALAARGTLIIANSTISGNQTSRGGGGLFIENGPVSITNSVISGNDNTNGGGAMFISAADVSITNSTITGNYTANTVSSTPGGILADSANLTLRNSIVWGNSNNGNTAPQIINDNGTTTVTNSLIQGGQFGALDADPLFVTPITASATPSTAGNFQLSDDSLAIDAGANANVPADTLDVNGNSNTTEDAPDRAGNTRRYDDIGVADTGVGTAPIVDLGAYEKQTNTPAAEADLSITKTDGVTSATPGGSVTYTITASNAGPSNAPSATVADTFSASLTGVTWTCVGAGGGTCTAAGSGSISDTVNLPVGGSVTYTATATISPSATGTLVNVAVVSMSGGVTDPNPANNSNSDTTTLTPQADLSITKTDGVTSATPGGSVTYTITASNAGPSNAPSATVADTFPAVLTGTWTCVGAGGGTCTAAGSGNISDNVNLPAGGSVTYTVTAAISAAATDLLINTATVSSGVTDPNPANNSATDTDTVGGSADLSITKTDGVTSAIPGGSVTYTITASNAGPSNAPSATVADTFPAVLTGTWTCVGAGGATCAAAGSGNINDTVSLPAGGSVTYTVTAAISAAATGTLSNTATVTSAVTDPNPANNSATDTTTLTPQVDLSITKTDGVTSATPGGSVTYTITASNAGPSDAPSAMVADTLPAELSDVTWTCVGTGGGTCPAAGVGDINDAVNLPAGGSVTYTVTATISAAATGTLSNTATVISAVTDPNPANNSATDNTTLAGSADLSITKTDGVTSATPGGSVTYTITASNAGPSDATSATVADTLPAVLSGATWTCISAGGGTCTAAGSGNINDTVNLPAGGSVTYTVSAAISAAATGTLSNTAIVTSGVTDPNPGNNSATDTTTLAGSADLSITKTDGLTNVMPSDMVTYTIVASNAGPSDAPSAMVADTLPAELSDVTWTCVGTGGGTCPAAGVGDINDAVNLPAGGSVTYTVSAVVSLTATGTLSNTATVSADGVTDPNPANNSATDVDTIDPLPTALLKNGGFETAGGKPKKAKRWNAEAPAVTDKRICRPAVAFEGSCAYRFHFNGTIIGGAKRALVQKILSPSASVGDMLDFSLYARATGLTTNGRARAIIRYSGGGKQVIKVIIPSGSSPYTLYTGSAVLADTPVSIVVKLEPRGSKGTMFVDSAALTATSSTRSSPVAGVLPPPEAPAGFRR